MRMKSMAIAWSSAIGLLVTGTFLTGRAQPGPDDDGAVLRLPGEEPRPRTLRAPPEPSPSSAGPSTTDVILANLTVDPRYAMNRDIEPTPNLGPWMVCVHSYITKEAPQWARQMTAELRSNPKYRLPAYVFTYGIEERHKEYARVKTLLDQQRQFAKDKGLPIMYATRSKFDGDAPLLPNEFSLAHVLNMVGSRQVTVDESDDLPLAYALNMLKVKHIPVQCAVLVGGYPDENAAHRALLRIKDLPAPDQDKVKMDVKFYGRDEDPNRPGRLKKDSGVAMYVNPFKRAFVCRNPSIRQELAPESANDGMDMKTLRRLNNGEPYTLLNCKKPITLAIKQFQTFTTVQTRDEPSVLQKFGFLTREGEGVDQAAHDAHTLAEYLRNSNLEAYVLHTKFSSVVTVGGFDNLEDPNLRAMEATLRQRLPAFEAQMRRLNQGGPLQSMMFFPRPMPMKVPH
ncbi:MAG: hypothetical protein L0Y71_09800 [Gemmataceae bacterium]|nr:hypothetical protein [Gemmataceae bacterium]